MPSDSGIRFEPVTAADFELLRHWMQSPPMNEWWGDPDEEMSWVTRKVEGRDATRPYIFFHGNEPAGYIQYWTVGDEIDDGNASKAPWLLEFPRDAVGVDLSIGRPELLGKGIGTAALRAFVARLFDEGRPIVTIDPDESNARAIRSYEKAGFAIHGRYPHDGIVTVLMTITPERFMETAP